MEQGPKSLRVYYRKLWKKKIGGEVFVVTVEENSRIAVRIDKQKRESCRRESRNSCHMGRKAFIYK